MVADDAALADRAVASTDSILNIPPTGVDPAVWEKEYLVTRADDAVLAEQALQNRNVAGVMIVGRGPDGRIEVTYRTNDSPSGVRAQLIGFAAIAVGHPRLDVRAAARIATWRRSSSRPTRSSRSTCRRAAAEPPIDPQEVASRAFLGDRVRRPPVPDRDHLRDVGRDRGRRREEQPGHGADDQRRVAAPAADRQGRRDRRRPG